MLKYLLSIVGSKPQEALEMTQIIMSVQFIKTKVQQVSSKLHPKFYNEYVKIHYSEASQQFVVNLKTQAEILTKDIQQINQFSDMSDIYKSVKFQITNQFGIFYYLIKLWADYISLQIRNYVYNKQSQIKIKSMFHIEFSIFENCICEIARKVYENVENYLIKRNKIQIDNNQRYRTIRNYITQCSQMKKVYDTFVKYVYQVQDCWKMQDLKDNDGDLQKIMKMKEKFLIFQKSINLLRLFFRQYSIVQKINIINKLDRTIQEEISSYLLKSNNIGKQPILLGADNKYSIYTYIIYHSDINLYGACCYLESILCSELKNVDSSYIQQGIQFPQYPALFQNYYIIKKLSSIRFPPQTSTSIILQEQI